MPNNNVFQYSSYIFHSKSKKTSVKIKSLIVLNSELLNKNSTFSCIIKSRKTGKTIEVAATLVITLWRQKGKQVFCDFNYLNLISIDQISIAVVRKEDFSNNVSINKKVFPFDIINYQLPGVIATPDKKIQNVAVCLKFVYNIPTMFYDWLDIQLKLNVTKVVLYDSGTNNGYLEKIFEKKSLSWFIETRPIYLDVNLACKIEQKHMKFGVIYLEKCKKIAAQIKFNSSNFDATGYTKDDISGIKINL